MSEEQSVDLTPASEQAAYAAGVSVGKTADIKDVVADIASANPSQKDMLELAILNAYQEDQKKAPFTYSPWQPSTWPGWVQIARMSGWKGHPRDLMEKPVVEAPEQTEGDRLRIARAARKRYEKGQRRLAEIGRNALKAGR